VPSAMAGQAEGGRSWTAAVVLARRVKSYTLASNVGRFVHGARPQSCPHPESTTT